MSAASTQSPNRPGPKPKIDWRGVAAGLLVLAVILSYANTFQVPFLLDDRSAITENPSLADLKDWGAILAPANSTTAGRPLLNATFALNRAWGGTAVEGYHVVNLVIHVLATLLLFGVARRTLQSARLAGQWGAVARPLALGLALLWGVHPLLTVAVTYLSQRAESLMGLFYLLTLYAFIRAVTTTKPSTWPGISVVACACGMMTKEVMMTAPVIVLLYDRVFCSDSFRAALSRRRWYYAGLALCWGLLAWLMMSSQIENRDVGLRAGADWFHYALTESKVVVLYAKLAVCPFPLVFDYGQEILVREFLPVLPYGLLVLGGLAGTVLLFRRGKLAAGFLAAAFFILLSPTSSFVPVVGQPMAESRMYLPLAAILAAGVMGLHRMLGRATWLVVGGLALVLGAFTVMRNHDFRSALMLWEDTIFRVPNNSRGQYNLANELVKTPGRSAEAIAHYEIALRLKPDLMEAHHNLANELAKIPGRAEDALTHYRQALELKPDLVEAHLNAARLLEQFPARRAEAIAHYEDAVRLRPADALVRCQLANLLARVPERVSDALTQYDEALRLDPNLPEGHANLGLVLASRGQFDEAIRHLETAVALKPDYVAARNLLAQVRAARGR